MTKIDTPSVTDIAAHLAGTDDLDRQAVLEFFLDHFGLDLSDRSDEALDNFLGWTKEGRDPLLLHESSQRVRAMLELETPEERELNEWEANLLAENDRKAAL